MPFSEEYAHRLHAIISMADAGIILKDRDGLILEWNIGAKNILGYEAEEIIGKTTKDYAPSGGLAEIDEINARLLNGEHITHVEVVRKHKDGRRIHCSASYTPILDKKSNITGSVAIFHDISEKKESERKRREAEEDLEKAYRDTEAILDEIPAPICAVGDADGRILGCNSAFRHMCASIGEELVETPISSYLWMPGEIKDSVMFRLRKVDSFRCRMRKLDGNVIDVEIISRPFVYRDQEAFAVHCMDLTKRQSDEQALRAAAEAAEEASRMKTAFLANMSHEIRTPMNGVIGFVDLALDDMDIAENARFYLNKIKGSAHSLLEIINDVLDISKIEAGKVEIEKSAFRINDIFKLCEDMVSAKAEEKGLTLYFYSEPFMSRKLIGDPTRLRQILLNLISNALKFTNVGIVKVTASECESGPDNMRVHFEVKDSGIGMNAEQIDKIFDPFVQADNSTTRQYGGTGLGLAITKNLVELMGGTLVVDSAVGIGSRFSFTLSFDTADAFSDNSETENEEHEYDKPTFSGEVLVCEDNVINRQVIKEHLARVGLEAVMTSNGLEGLNMARERWEQGRPFDLIFMDIHMPVMNGLETARKLVKAGNVTPVIALTANAMSSDKENYLRSGMAHYVSKPFKSQELWACLLKFLRPVTACPEISEAADSGASASVEAAFDYALGVEAVGDEQLYLRLRNEFFTDYQDACLKIETELEKGNRAEAQLRAHTLKGVARTLGAARLAEAALVVEGALKDGADGPSEEQINALCAALREALDSAVAPG